MRPRDPKRDKTSTLWDRLRSGSDMTVLLVVAAVGFATPITTRQSGVSQLAMTGILILVLLLAYVSARARRKLVDELRRRYEGGSNNTSEDSAAKRAESSR